MSHTRRDCGEKSKDCEFGKQTDDRILEHLIQTTKDSELVKRSIQKKWNLDQFLEEDINQQVKDMREDFKISKVEYQSKDFPKAASGAEEETRRRNCCNLPENENEKRRERERQKLWLLWRDRRTSSGLKLSSVRTTVFKMWQVQSLGVMLHDWCPTLRGT